MAFANFLVDHENHGAAHFKAAKFIATVKRELLIRNPVHALVVTRQLARIRYDGIAINDANATDIRRAHLDHENLGTVLQADLARQAFVDAEKAFHAFDATGIHRPQRSRAIARKHKVALDRAVDAVVIERCQINSRESTALEPFCQFIITQKALERISFALRLNQSLAIAIERACLRKHSIDRAHDFGISNGTHARLEPADKKFTDVPVMAQRIFCFGHIQLIIICKSVTGNFAQERDAQTRKRTKDAAHGILRQKLHKDVKWSVHEGEYSN